MRLPVSDTFDGRLWYQCSGPHIIHNPIYHATHHIRHINRGRSSIDAMDGVPTAMYTTHSTTRIPRNTFSAFSDSTIIGSSWWLTVATRMNEWMISNTWICHHAAIDCIIWSWYVPSSQQITSNQLWGDFSWHTRQSAHLLIIDVQLTGRMACTVISSSIISSAFQQLESALRRTHRHHSYAMASVCLQQKQGKKKGWAAHRFNPIRTLYAFWWATQQQLQ